MSKQGKIYSISLSRSNCFDMQWSHVAFFRGKDVSRYPVENTVCTNHTGQITESSIARVRRAQDRLMDKSTENVQDKLMEGKP